MTSLVSIGNDNEGAVLASIEGRALGLDAAGNIVQNTQLTRTGAPSRSVPGTVGVGIPYNLGITNAAGSTQYYSNVSFQVQDIFGNAVAGVFELDIWLSDAATGIGLTATTASGGISALASTGTILGTLTTSKAIRAITNASGLFTLVIIDSAKTGFYPVASTLSGMPVVVGAQLTTASYHA